MDKIKKFFAVTMTSIYLVSVENNQPVLTKLSLRGGSSINIGSKLTGPMLSIGRQLVLFMPERGGLGFLEKRIEFINNRYWLEKTSGVVGLFLKEEEARKCFGVLDAKVCDLRWIESTIKVLDEIGKAHPNFYIAQDSNLSLLAQIKP